MFEILDPIILPGKISETPLLIDSMPEISSGKDVPIPTINTPITNEGSFSHEPIISADFVKKFAEISKAANEAMKIKRFMSMRINKLFFERDSKGCANIGLTFNIDFSTHLIDVIVHQIQPYSLAVNMFMEFCM